MTVSNIAQCDMCSTVAENYLSFHRVKLFIEPPSPPPSLSERTVKTVELTVVDVEASLCPKCAEPLIAFQRALPITYEMKADRQKRLNERILSALKKTE